MTTPFIGEIEIFGFNFAPRGWALCNGTTLPIQQNTALFALIGTTYGGDGEITFQLPNLAGRAATQQGQGPGLSARLLGEAFGENTVTLTANEMPAHRHVLQANTAQGQVAAPTNAVPASSEEQLLFDGATSVAMTGLATSTGGGFPHENQQPYLGINFCIALQGIFPSFP